MNTLPVELIALITSHLSLRDTLALCQASREVLVDENLAKKALLNECIGYDIHYTQWDTWRECAFNFGIPETRDWSDYECQTFVDEPLPCDFQCLCKHSVFAYTDQGVFFKNKFLNLTQTSIKQIPDIETPIITPLNDGYEIQYKNTVLYVQGNYPQVKWTSSFIVAINQREENTCVSIKEFNDKHSLRCFTFSNSHVQVSVVGDKAFISCDTLLIEMTVSKGFYHVTAYTPCKQPPAILLHNNYKADAYSGYTVQQDEIHTQYALVYNTEGLVTALIDLKGRRVAKLSKQLNIVGHSKGVLGVWTYSPEYLKAQLLKQTGTVGRRSAWCIGNVKLDNNQDHISPSSIHLT